MPGRRKPRRPRPLLLSAAGALLALGLSGATLESTVLEGRPLDSALPAGAPANDDLAACQAIPATSGPTTFSGTTVGASSESGEPNASASDETVWFSWTPAEAGFAYLVPLSDGTSTAVHVYWLDGDDPTCASATPSALAGHEVAVSTARVGATGASGASGSGGAASAAGPDSAVIPVIESTTYYIQVENPSGDGAPFDFSLDQPGGGTPANATFASAASLDGALAAAAAGSGSADPAAVGTTAGSAPA
ncbi:MAG TPA: hypothetical protein VMD59_22665, partial [Acidimicrobiales bacterium]|nr:hypothetical protein [Acidimicrobiales bacterium]